MVAVGAACIARDAPVESAATMRRVAAKIEKDLTVD